MKTTLAGPARDRNLSVRDRPVSAAPRPQRNNRLHSILLLVLLLSGFVLLQCSLPLASAIKIGADEDFAISKAFQSLKGYKLYTQIWNDQPPLHTFLLKSIFLHVSHSILAARLLTVGASLLLLSAFYALALRANGLPTAALAAALLVASPGFLELSASAMVELPGLAPVIAGLCLLHLGPRSRWRSTELLAGIVFAVALQIKLIGALYLPLAALVLWLRQRGTPEAIRQWSWSVLAFGLATLIGFLIINWGTGESLSAQLAQSRASHFTSAKSLEYGAPADYPFDWSALVKNWDTTLPAAVGVLFLIRGARQSPVLLLPLAWLTLTLIVFTTYRPWWNYYYVHNAVPLCWCAGAGVVGTWQAARTRRRAIVCAAMGVYALVAGIWLGGRLYLQAADIRKAPRLYSSLVLKEIDRYRRFTDFLFTTEAVNAFHTGIPLPPRLSTLSLKRFWTGDMTNAKLVNEMRQVRPGILLLANDTREVPFQDLLRTDYRLVYQDSSHRLYVLPEIIAKAEPW